MPQVSARWHVLLMASASTATVIAGWLTWRYVLRRGQLPLSKVTSHTSHLGTAQPLTGAGSQGPSEAQLSSYCESPDAGFDPQVEIQQCENCAGRIKALAASIEAKNGDLHDGTIQRLPRLIQTYT